MNIRTFVCAAVALFGGCTALSAQTAPLPKPIRHTMTFQNTQREYFVWPPPQFDRNKQYWLLVAIYSPPMLNDLQRSIAASGFDAIMISPTFRDDNLNLTRFPVSTEKDFFREVMNAARAAYSIKPKILLTGYSRGAQFVHRYAFAHPDEIAALAPLASGTWTTPDGRLLVEEIGEVRNARTFLTNPENAKGWPARLADMFDPAVAAVAEIKAVQGSEGIPMLVMCGTLDPRLPIAREFARSLETLGYRVATEWPRTPHACPNQKCAAEFGAEFARYSDKTVEFFQQAARGK
jgi:pimeloyl-ACP methyl ester carboxylesterase